MRVMLHWNPFVFQINTKYRFYVIGRTRTRPRHWFWERGAVAPL
jgi:hypothetical protein